MEKTGKIILIIALFVIVAVLGVEIGIVIGNKKSSNEEVANLKNEIANMQENQQTLLNQINEENKNKEENSETTNEVNNTISTDSTKNTDTEKNLTQLIQEAFEKYIKETANKNSVDKLDDYKLDSIVLYTEAENDRILKIDGGSAYKKGDMLGTITFSVKPVNKDRSMWSAGNGREDGEWIVNKSLTIRIRGNDIEIGGTGL